MLAPMPARPPALALATLIALAFALPLGHAAPSNKPDPLAQLLVDKGLIEATPSPEQSTRPAKTAPGLGQQVQDKASELVLSAMSFLGVPYKRGGASSDTGFDCSGFTRHIYENSLGLLLPRKVDDQAKASGLAPVKRAELKPGDLVFFNTLKRTFSHVGIYLGDDKFIHAPKPGGEVRVESMSVRYWAKRFSGARRAPEATPPTPAAAPAGVTPVAEQPASSIPNDLAP